MTNLNKFFERHQLHVLDKNKRAHRMTKMNTKFFKFEDDYNKLINDTVAFETEPLYTIEVAESELHRIADFEAEVFNHMESGSHYRMFEAVMEQKEQERYLKDKYPAVKKAYEHYSLILKLAESGEL
jgi:hypothetical protein